MKVLVTGGAGYIGSILVPELLHKGYEVVVLDNFMYKQTSLLDICHHKKLEVVKEDVRNKELLSKYLKVSDIILPLACFTGAPICDKDPWGAKAVNLDAIKTLMSLKSPDQIVIFPTTNSGYGIGEKDIYCTEETSLRPVSLYGRLKVEAEDMVLSSENSMTLRFATLFGMSPRMRLDLLVNDFTYRAVRDRYLVIFEGHFKRNYLHVRDAAQAFLHCLDHFDSMRGQPYNVGLSEANLSKLELSHVIRKYIPTLSIMESKIGEDPDKRNYIVSNDKIEKTGFRTTFSLEEGVCEIIKGYPIIQSTCFGNI